METLRVDIINPKAKKILKELADLNLIKIKEEKKSDFSKLVKKIRSKPVENINLEEITKEVESVRNSRYEE
ncbi:hypothetical protein JRG66_06420 [Salinimicrobium tongyeongense]|uniref:Antitoxin n=1 Tax=Salinimicrobium tongyeongense TaxID=2809707 RepID=A0ABY6NVC5_9FLAO|nr:hypothetical protein [Salinimicrobium tongyeongense]UZH56491.1 hypothetical protein JRG66_06420 [Salinimicrobium tongyeongense]